METPRDETGTAEVVVDTRVYAPQVLDVFLLETDLTDERVLFLAGSQLLV